MIENLKEILENHQLWLSGEGGECADLYGAMLFGADFHGANLSGADLRFANLRGANLFGANLRSANLFGANLRSANLSGSNLRSANLSGSNLRYANLFSANLFGANLSGANLFGADLSGADLSGAMLSGANLRGANLRGADLRYANLRGSDLSGVDLSGARLPDFQIVPEIGSFYAWKKTAAGVISIMIPSEAKRTSSLVGRKCRAEYVVVIDGEGVGGFDMHSLSIQYLKGETIRPDSYDDDIRVECTHGIHFFMTKKEAEEY